MAGLRRQWSIVPITLAFAGCAAVSEKPSTTHVEVRGIPATRTAYSRVLLVDPDSVAGAVALYCKALRDSMETIPNKVQNIWALLKAENDARIERNCRTSGNDSTFCGFSEKVNYGVVEDMARDGIPWDAPETYRREVRQMLEYVATRKRQLTEEYATRFTQQVAERLYRDLVRRDTVTRVLRADGTFDVALADSALSTLVMIKSPDQFEFAVLPAARGTSPQVTAYDAATFGIERKCAN